MTTDKPESSEPKDDNTEQNKTGAPAEIRYVPVEYLPDFNKQNADDEIDLLDLAKKVWAGRWVILTITMVFFGIGIFWALFSPVEYESETVLMPEVQQASGGGTSRLLQQFGIGGGMQTGGGAQGVIPPMIYPRIVNSVSFQQELLEKELYFQTYDVRATWPDFLEHTYRTPLTSHVKNYTIGLPMTLIGAVRSLFSGAVDEPDTDELESMFDEAEANFVNLTAREYDLIRSLRDRISVRQDVETGLLTTTVKLQDPRAAAELNRYVVELLKEYITDYRTDKATQDLVFVESQKHEARQRFEEAQMRLAQFQDENITLTTARARTELERLQDERNLALSVYSSLSQRFEEARLNVQEQTPVFTEIQGFLIPTERSEPQRGLLVLVSTFLGGIIGLSIVLIWPFFKHIKNDLIS